MPGSLGENLEELRERLDTARELLEEWREYAVQHRVAITWCIARSQRRLAVSVNATPVCEGVRNSRDLWDEERAPRRTA